MSLSVPVSGTGRVPPHDLEAEASVLGAILLDQTALSRVLEIIQPEDFYRENNAQVYRAAIELFREGEPIDLVTLGDQLQKQGVLERVGGRAHLATLVEQTPTAANVEYYGRIVKNHAYKRALISAGGEVTALGYNDALEAEEALNSAQAKVFSIAEQRTGAGMERLYDLLKPAMDRIDAQMASGGGVVGVPVRLPRARPGHQRIQSLGHDRDRRPAFDGKGARPRHPDSDPRGLDDDGCAAHR